MSKVTVIIQLGIARKAQLSDCSLHCMLAKAVLQHVLKTYIIHNYDTDKLPGSLFPVLYVLRSIQLMKVHKAKHPVFMFMYICCDKLTNSLSLLKYIAMSLFRFVFESTLTINSVYSHSIRSSLKFLLLPTA